MAVADLFRFSGTALRGHRLRTLLSLLGVAIGVGAVVILTGLGEGARRYVTGEFSSLGTNLLIIIPGRIETTGGAPIMGGVPHDLSLDDAEALRREVPLLRHVAPISLGSAPARHGDRSREVNVVGATAEVKEVRHLRIASGRFLPRGDPKRGQGVCVIGSKVRTELFPDGNSIGAVLRLGEYRFRVIGVLASRGVSIGFDVDELVYVPVANGLKMFNQPGLFRILAQVRSHQEIPEAKRQVIQVITERHDGEEDVTVLTQDAVISTFGQIFTALTAALAGIAAISLSVAGIGIMNVMLVSVSERTGEIGLLKALGAGRGQILFVFLVEATIIATAGGIAGLGVGLVAARVFMVFFPGFPVSPPPWAVLSAIGLSLVVGMLFGLLPARRAARLDPVAALARR
jgi:putative ABC transport system permease protein